MEEITDAMDELQLSLASRHGGGARSELLLARARDEIREICSAREGWISWVLWHFSAEIETAAQGAEAFGGISSRFEAAGDRLSARLEAEMQLRQRFGAEAARMRREALENEEKMEQAIARLETQRADLRALWRRVFGLQFSVAEQRQALAAWQQLPDDEGDVFLQVQRQAQAIIGYLKSAVGGVCG